MTETLDKGAMTQLLEMVGDDPEFVSDLVDTYLADAPGLLAAMRAAAEAASSEGLVRPAHTLKGNSRSIGATVLAEICRGLEEAGRTGSMNGTAEDVAAAEAEYQRVVAALASAREAGWRA